MKYGFDREDFKISYSRINAYLFCPYKYKLIYIDNQYVPLNADITFGQIIHKTLEKYHSRGGKNMPQLSECYDESWENKGFASPQQNFEYYRRGTAMLENYFKSFSVSNVKILYTEKSFDANIGKYRFIGIIDRIDEYPDGTKEIMDYKTHIKIWDSQRVDKDLQLTLYAYACKNIFGFTPDKISVYFLSDNIKIYTKRSNKEIEDGVNLALETAGKITGDDFEPDTSKCANCDFKLKCKNSSYTENV
ncbi:MAG: PD-(D/E)XK nuclease family protein [Endomicrobium sp.]|jgi:RecB family exonuclease|nr:PD-(D/E)XK nuclease family protein [Endomicrobium sp.]